MGSITALAQRQGSWIFFSAEGGIYVLSAIKQSQSDALIVITNPIALASLLFRGEGDPYRSLRVFELAEEGGLLLVAGTVSFADIILIASTDTECSVRRHWRHENARDRLLNSYLTGGDNPSLLLLYAQGWVAAVDLSSLVTQPPGPLPPDLVREHLYTTTITYVVGLIWNPTKSSDLFVALGSPFQETEILKFDRNAGFIEKSKISLKSHKGIVFALAASASQPLFATASDDRTIHIWERGSHSSYTLIRKVQNVHRGRIWGLQFSENDNELLAIGECGLLSVTNLDEPSYPSRKLFGTMGTCGTSINSDGWCGFNDGRILRIPPPCHPLRVSPPQDRPREVIPLVGPWWQTELSQTSLLVVTRGGDILRFDCREGVYHHLASHDPGNSVSCVTLEECTESHTTCLLILGTGKATLEIFTLSRSFQCTHLTTVHTEGIGSIDRVLINDNHIVSGGHPGVISLYDRRTGAVLFCQLMCVVPEKPLAQRPWKLTSAQSTVEPPTKLARVSKHSVRCTALASRTHDGNTVLFVGSEVGTLYKLELKGAQLLCTAINATAHPYKQITHIHVEQDKLISLGTDGRRNEYDASTLFNSSVTKFRNFDFLHSETDTVLCAFQGSMGYLYHQSSSQEFHSFLCGGPRRPISVRQTEKEIHLALLVEAEIQYFTIPLPEWLDQRPQRPIATGEEYSVIVKTRDARAPCLIAGEDGILRGICMTKPLTLIRLSQLGSAVKALILLPSGHIIVGGSLLRLQVLNEALNNLCPWGDYFKERAKYLLGVEDGEFGWADQRILTLGYGDISDPARATLYLGLSTAELLETQFDIGPDKAELIAVRLHKLPGVPLSSTQGHGKIFYGLSNGSIIEQTTSSPPVYTTLPVAHTRGCNGVLIVHDSPHLVASVGDDQLIILQDLRQTTINVSIKVNSAGLRDLDICQGHLFTVGADGVICALRIDVEFITLNYVQHYRSHVLEAACISAIASHHPEQIFLLIGGASGALDHVIFNTALSEFQRRD